MPRLTRIFIKTSLVYLVLALAVGMLLALAPVQSMPPLTAQLRPVYFHLFMVGWVTQLIFGVGYWMFPKYSSDRPRGNEAAAWAVYWLLNAGLVLRVVAEPLYGLHGAALWGWALALSALLQWLAGLTFVANTWPRLRSR
jgi:cbb3-type cytochrome oxidase subunit 1